MEPFLGCPRELIDSILEQLFLRDLVALSITNKRLYDLATPLLYSRIDFSVRRDNPRPLIRLCRSVFNKPELATHIKHVRLRDGEPELHKLYEDSFLWQYKAPKVSPPQPTDDDGIPEFTSFIANTGLSYADIWIEKLREGDLNAFVALLLSRLPNLASLRVGHAVNQFLGKVFETAVFDTSNHGLPRFQHLEEISSPGPMDGDPGRNPDFCNPRGMMALLSLPSMRSVSGWCLNPSSLPFTWPAGPPDMAHLTSLHLSFVHVDFLAQILERTPSLKCLSWEWKYLPDLDPLNTDTLDLDRFVEALKPVQDTLEDLTIKVTNTMAYGDSDYQYINVRGSLNGLSSFSNIKRFKAPFTVLLPDWDCDENPTRRLEDSMPPNVEVVTLTDQGIRCDTYAYSQEDEMAKLRAWVTETASTRTPSLVEICLYLVYGSDWIDSGNYEDFERVFEGSSLKHRIIKQEDEKPWEEV
ncbi:hypothetical protein BU23DRAFT_530112 [Bimuria novae-zelandiae CBS 107.79]|uniref:F-box domain-containing protein n=1 Tax=Bimuria novae-zelandiae CBS 107.79 TaxID=1447943 RepID=A0A6A5VQP3_9PLEO|nr:hypothetical protein BU23DRAFT_530112 [Bimuria novae-zelandiae CBS 107.79]